MKDIICSIGPSSYDKNVIREMIRNGMTWARLNFSHGSYDEYSKVISYIHEFEDEFHVDVVLMQDLQGPKIRLGLITPASLLVEKDEVLILDTKIRESINAPIKILPVQYVNFAVDVRKDEIIYVDDGQLKLKVLDVLDENRVECVALNTWLVSSNKGINLPDTEISSPAVTEKDIEDLKVGLTLGVEVVSLSFVRKAEDLRYLKKLIAEFGYDLSKIKIMAKIERPESVENLEEILMESDCVMIARGDLGVEIGLENLGRIQKYITKVCLEMNKDVFPATDFLKSMLNSPTPSRSEVVDIYNALIDGVTGVLLSNETSVGKYPVEACIVVKKIIDTLDK